MTRRSHRSRRSRHSMKRFGHILTTMGVWLYSGLVSLWFGLHGHYGDQIWWLALLNTFAPYFFAPLLLLLPMGLIYRRRRYWLGLLPAVGLFLWLYGQLFLPPWPDLARASDENLTVMTFNIWGGSRSQETARTILENGVPDVVVLQELTPRMGRILLDELSDIYPYHIYGSSWYDQKMGVLSRYPLYDLNAEYLGEAGWQIQTLYVETDPMQGRGFILYNVHPHSSNLLYYYTKSKAVIREVEMSFRIRQHLIQTLVDDIGHQTKPVIVAGDFNSTDQSDVHAIMSSALTDAHRVAGWGFGHTFPAYSGRFHGIPIFARQMRLDMIFFSTEDFEALTSEVGQEAGESDHLPVITELRWLEK